MSRPQQRGVGGERRSDDGKYVDRTSPAALGGVFSPSNPLRAASLVAQMVKNPPAGDPGSTPGSGRSPREGNGNPLQYSCLESSIDRGAWWASVHGVTKRWAVTEQLTLSLSTSLELLPKSAPS